MNRLLLQEMVSMPNPVAMQKTMTRKIDIKFDGQSGQSSRQHITEFLQFSRINVSIKGGSLNDYITCIYIYR